MKRPIVYDEGTNPGNGWRMLEPTHRLVDLNWQGYHTWQHDETNTAGEVVGQTPCGSFEVFYVEEDRRDGCERAEGWYWWSCFPGCLPDGEPSGPFPTAEGAYLDAIGE